MAKQPTLQLAVCVQTDYGHSILLLQFKVKK